MGLRTGLGLAVLALLLLAVPAGAPADQIAYNCGYDICLINPDTPSEHSNLTQTVDESSGGAENSPSWSPDGHWIAYSAQYGAGNSSDLWVIDATKSAAEGEAIDVGQNVEGQVNTDEPPAWSPDGSLIAYEEADGASSSEHHVYVSPFDGSFPQVPIGGAGSANQGIHPTWTADGRVVFSRNSLFIANSDGTGISPFISGSGTFDAVASPDGKYIAYAETASPTLVKIARTDGSGSVTLTKRASVSLPNLTWSPDSTRVAYISAGNSANDGIWVAPVDKSNDGHVVEMPSNFVGARDPSFSPDGTRIAFDADINTGYSEQVFVGPSDGSGKAEQLTQGGPLNVQPVWKPGPGGPKSETPAGGGGGGSNPPVKIRLAALKKVEFIGNKLAVGIDCKAEGGHPTGAVAEFCAAVAEASYTQGQLSSRPSARPKPKVVAFAKGSAKVPVGKEKKLILKLTGAGKKLAKPGRTLKLQLSVKVTVPGQKLQTQKKTIKVKVPKK